MGRARTHNLPLITRPTGNNLRDMRMHKVSSIYAYNIVHIHHLYQVASAGDGAAAHAVEGGEGADARDELGDLRGGGRRRRGRREKEGEVEVRKWTVWRRGKETDGKWTVWRRGGGGQL